MSVPSSSPTLNRELALSRVGGDVELLREIAVLFLEDYPKALEEIRDALARGDARGVERSAHGLKGSVANFGADQAVDAARQIEEMGHHQRLAEVAHVLNTLDLALAALRPELESI
jgi:HPt (histidine-containing phosphotransfer) domain-containing protein